MTFKTDDEFNLDKESRNSKEMIFFKTNKLQFENF